ncbi:MAG: hypothetical protein ACOYB3_00750 [Azonexus sp.]
MRIYLAEGLKGSITFFPDKVPTNLVQENLPDGRKGWRIPGRFSESDVVNGNGRRYRKAVWEKNLQEGSTLKKLIGENGAFGLLEHPKDGQVTLESPISHSVTGVKMDESGVVTGEITIIDYGDNSPGRKLKALIEQGYNPRVSSRGFGSLVKGTDGVDEVQEDYVCEGWDVVIKPSFETAVLNPDRSSPALDTVLGRTTEDKKVNETTLKTEPTQDSPPVPAASSASASTAEATTKPTVITESTAMNITEVKQRIAQLRSMDTSKLAPKAFAEGVAVMAELHNAVATYVAEDAKRSWEGTKLHQEIETIENGWASAQTAPTKAANKLRENQNKVLHVCKNLVETALKYKNALAESLKASASQQRLIEEITTNGQGWMALANKRKARLEFLEKKYVLATECLQVMTARYNEDMSALGAHIVNLEFKDNLTPELQTALKEAKTPKAVLAIREQLEGKPEAVEPTTPPTPGAKPTPAKANESKPAPAAAAPVTESKPAATAVPVVESSVPSNPRCSVNESLGILSRLSLASAK